MTTTYTPAPPDITDRIAEVLMQYHGDLAEHGVTISILMATSDDDKPAVTKDGYPCAAKIEKTSYKNRCLGIADAVITIEADIWKTFAEAEKVAVLDHELMHLELVYDKDGALKTDDANRPKLKMRLHDVQYGAFAVVAKRHGEASQEVQQANVIMDRYGQLFFAWTDDRGGESEKSMESSTVAITSGQIKKLASK